MRDPVVLSSELLKKGGAVQSSAAQFGTVKKGGAVESSTVRSSEPIEEVGFCAKLYRARF